jgi:hypothetical protein
MYAVAGKWVMDPAQRELQDRVLHEEIVPMVKAAPGFVSAHWSRALDGIAHVSFVVFENQASAEGFVKLVESDPHGRDEAGVESNWLTVTEIIATA